MNKKILILAIAIVIVLVIIGAYWFWGKTSSSNTTGPETNITQVSDPIAQIATHPNEDVVDRPVKISGQISASSPVNGTLYLGETKIDVKNSQFEYDQMPKGTYEAELVDENGMHYELNPNLIHILAPIEIEFELAV